MTAPLLVIAAGGTGGHMFPAQSLAEEMLRRGWRVKLSTDPRGSRYTGGFPDAVNIEVVNASTFARGGILAKLITPFKIASGVLSAVQSMRKDRPTLVAGFGGYPAVPAMSAASCLRLPRIIHEQNGVLGRVNQLFAKRVDAVACGTWPTELPKGVQGVNVGNPVRSAILLKAGAPYPEITKGDLTLLVMGGSQGSSIVAATAAKSLAFLSADMRARLRVSCQAREADAAECAALFADAGVDADIKPFFDDVPDRMAAAHLVVTRAGASTVADLSVIGRPSILIPLAIAIRDEQTANAKALVDAGAAQILTEPDLTPETLAQAIKTILTDANAASKMASSALSVGKPLAARHLADLVEKTAQKE